MNIFFLHRDPTQCAIWHNDKHLVKMILETAQLLSTAHHVLSPIIPEPIYKKTHVNHPSAIWVRQSVHHYKWTHELLRALCVDYTYRYNKTHKTVWSGVFEALEESPETIPCIDWIDPPQCMPDEYKVLNDCEQAYRNYYMGPKAHLGVWTRRNTPTWFGVTK